MQRSQKAQQIVCNLQQILQKPEREEEQFKQIYTHILQIVDDGEICEQIAEASLGYGRRQQVLLSSAASDSRGRSRHHPPVSQMTENTAFRTELLARFLLVMCKTTDQEEYP